MKHHLLAVLFLTSCGSSATHSTKAIVTEYKQKGSTQAFTQFLQQATPAQRVPIVYFYADWCGPCKAIAPVFGSLSEQHAGEKVKFAKVNVDKQEDIARLFNITAYVPGDFLMF